MWPYRVVVGHTAKQLKALNEEDKGVQGLSPDISEALNRCLIFVKWVPHINSYLSKC